MFSWNLFFLGVSTDARTFLLPSLFSMTFDTCVKVYNTGELKVRVFTYLRVNHWPLQKVVVQYLLDHRSVGLVGPKPLAQSE